MRSLFLLPLLLLLACDSGSGDSSDDPPATPPGDEPALSGRYFGVGVPDDARESSVVLVFGEDGLSVGNGPASLFFRVLDGPGNSIEEVSGSVTARLTEAGALTFSCACAADFRGTLDIQAAGTAAGDEITLSFTGDLRMDDVVLSPQ